MNFYQYLYGDKIALDKKSEYDERKYYLVKCKDGEHELRKLIDYIGQNGNRGHSFDIVVDPGSKEHEKHFFWDGDGVDRIDSIVETKTGDDKELVGILLTALERVRRLTFTEAPSSENEVKTLKIALDNIHDIVEPLLSGAEYEDYLRDSLREIRFICDNEDSPEQKVEDIRYMAKEALK